jgi:hypothetical protein
LKDLLVRINKKEGIRCIKTQKKEEEKKSIYRIELAVRCERLLHVEGLTVTLR